MLSAVGRDGGANPAMTVGRSLRLLFVVKELHRAAGGAERVLAMVTAGLARLGHQVTVLSFDRPGAPPFYRFDDAVERVQLGIGQASESSTITDLGKRAWAIRRFVKRRRPDVAIGFMNSAFVPLALGLMGTGVPIVASEHISYDHYADRTLERLLLWLTYRLSDRVTVPTDPVRHGFPAALKPRMWTMVNPVDPLSGGARKRSRARTKPLLLAAGRLTRQKDFSTLVAAFAKVAARFPDWRVRILGEGILRDPLERQVAALGLGERVELPGIAVDMASQYGEADIFVMSSRYESLGLVTAEALACGVPVIGFADCPGTNDLIVSGSNGLLVAGSDRAEVLAAGMARMMADDQLRARMARAAPASVSHLFGDAAVRNWDAMLADLVGEMWFDLAPARPAEPALAA